MGLVQARDGSGAWDIVADSLPLHHSLLASVADPRAAPAALLLRERLRTWRFYDGFRTDPDAPARQLQIGTRTLALANDGRDLAAALQTIREMDGAADLDEAVSDAFPGARLEVLVESGARFGVELHQRGLLRPLSQAELSEGTLRYLLWIAVLLTRAPPALMVLNEPETSLHPDLLPALARLIVKASGQGQVWVVTHSPLVRDLLEAARGCRPLALAKEMGETVVVGQRTSTRPAWKWPAR
jgi:predicted ATPase